MPMLLKRTYLTLLFIALVFGAFAAGDSTDVAKKVIVKKHAHYLSINGTFFLQQFFNFTTSTAIITPSPYIVEYKYLPNHHGFRFDAGGSFSQKKSFLDSSQVQITNSTTFNLRAGYIYQHKIAKHWSFFTGVDVIFANNISFLRNNTTEDVVTTTNNSVSFGAGPSLGIQFAINDRIGFFTETALYYQVVVSNSGTTSINFPETNATQTGVENDLKFIIPTSLFFYFRL
jgi:hypothetical protein